MIPFFRHHAFIGVRRSRRGRLGRGHGKPKRKEGNAMTHLTLLMNNATHAQPSGVRRDALCLPKPGLRKGFFLSSGRSICTCRNSVRLSYNANRTQELGRVGSGMRVALVLLGHSHGCSSRRRLNGTVSKCVGSPRPSSTSSFAHQSPSVTIARTGFTCTHKRLCRELGSRQDFRKASFS